MPFYIRKSVSAGPFRFNLSKSGLGVSVGIKGLRFGTGPRGHYVHAGRGGLYYRASLGGEPSRRSSPPVRHSAAPNDQPMSYDQPGIQMVQVSSGSVLEMQDERFGNLLSELNSKQKLMSLMLVLGLSGTGIGVLAMIIFGSGASVVAVLLAVVGIGLGAWLDTSRRSAVVLYDLDADVQNAYEELAHAFDRLAGCGGKWHIDAGGAIHDLHTWKRNAGAHHLVVKNPTTLVYDLPRVLKSNITPPSLGAGKERLYFLPDVVLVVDGDSVGAVAYDALNIRWQDSRFIEDAAVPADAQIVGHNWKHPNKNGGPDRRFKDNRQIPVCLYESAHFTSSNGLNELMQWSRSGVTQPFAEAIQRLTAVTGRTSAALALPHL